MKNFLLFLLFFSLAAEKRLIVLVTTYQNSKWCVKNIRSIFSQKYENFFVVLRDDASTDDTFEKISQEVELLGVQDKICLHKNNVRRGKAANIWLTLHQIDIGVPIDDSDIIVICDGDDWYPHEKVFKHIDEVFSTENIWVTYGGFREYPSNKACWNKGIPKAVIANNRFREFGKNSSQQRCFYAWLYRQIKIEDLMFKGRFAKTAGDVAKMMPMLEMASERHYFFRDCIYVYNRANVINDDKVDKLFQIQTCRSFLRDRKKYYRLEQPILRASPNSFKVDLIYLTEKLNQELLSKFNGLNSTYVIKNDQLRESLISMLKESVSDYILLLSGKEKIDDVIDLKKVVTYLSKSHALRFDLLVDKSMKKKAEFLGENVYAGQLMGQLAYLRNSFYANVYSRQFLLEEIEKLNFNDTGELLNKWRRIGFLNERFRVILFFG